MVRLTGFDSYHEIAVRDHVRVPQYWRTHRTWANTKKHIRRHTFNLEIFLTIFPESSYLNTMKDR